MELQQIAQLLNRHGVRPTQQRMAVYEYLLQHRTHPSADTVYEALVKQHPTFSRTTVYNSLHALVQASLVQELTVDTEERRYDADMKLHGHFLCRHCGGLADIPLDEALMHSLRPAGYTVEMQELYFTGLCPACTKSSNH